MKRFESAEAKKVEVAKKIGSFEISIKPFDDCCTVFLPKFPAIKPNLEKVIKAENKLNIEEIKSGKTMAVAGYIHKMCNAIVINTRVGR